MRFLLAPDKFKGTLSATAAVEAMAAGVRDALPDAQIDRCPMSDGGEGFVDAMLAATGGERRFTRVTGPLPEMKVDAAWGVLPAIGQSAPTAVIEMSAASGLWRVPEALRDPDATTTFGTGELLVAAAQGGCRRILLGIGGSATVDGGIGCCQAAGLPVILEGGEPTSPTEPLCGRDLPRVVMVKSHRGGRLTGVEVVVACDVANPLAGPNGAATVFGPQKGATPEQVRRLDAALAQLARRCDAVQIAERPGAGAAGGLGFALMAFFGATLRPGAELVIDANGLRNRLRDIDLCITGEGRIDASTLSGKAPVAVATACREAGVPCVAIAGSVDRTVALPFDQTLALTDTADETDAKTNAAALLRATARAVARALRPRG